jgi:hypothetical protein
MVAIGVRCQVSGVRCQVSGVRCQVSGVRCQVSGVRCQVRVGRVSAFGPATRNHMGLRNASGGTENSAHYGIKILIEGTNLQIYCKQRS